MKTVALSEQTHRSVAPAGLPSGRPGDVGNVSRIGRCFPDHAGQHVDFGVARPDARPLGGDLLFDAAVHVGGRCFAWQAQRVATCTLSGPPENAPSEHAGSRDVRSLQKRALCMRQTRTSYTPWRSVLQSCAFAHDSLSGKMLTLLPKVARLGWAVDEAPRHRGPGSAPDRFRTPLNEPALRGVRLFYRRSSYPDRRSRHRGYRSFAARREAVFAFRRGGHGNILDTGNLIWQA